MPHFPDKLKINDLIVNMNKWQYTGEELSGWHIQFGYKDLKPIFIGDQNSGELQLKIKIGNANYMWICGGENESLKHSMFKLDKDAGNKFDKNENYVPSLNRIIWNYRKYMVIFII